MTQSHSAPTLTTTLAGDAFYRIEGDSLYFGSRLTAPNATNMLLQVHAQDLGAKDAKPQIIASARVSQTAAAAAQVTCCAPLQAPASQKFYQLALVALAEEDGELTELDRVTFAQTQQFPSLALEGAVDVQLRDDQAAVSVARVRNLRQPELLSGSISIELWATKEPYSGGKPEGHWLGGMNLGQLLGQNSFESLQFNLEQLQRPEGGWAMSLLLREWNGFEMITRDYRALPPLLASTVVSLADAKAEAKIDTKIEAKTEAKAEPKAEPKAEAEAPATSASEPETAAPKATAAAKTTAAPATAAPAKAEAPAKTEAPAKALISLPSVNTSDAETLMLVKGISPRLAKLIVQGRPYEQLSDLSKVRGIGMKMVNKLRDQITL